MTQVLFSIFLRKCQPFDESGCLGLQPKMGGRSHPKLNILWETDSEEVQWWKGEKNFEKKVKSAWNC